MSHQLGSIKIGSASDNAIVIKDAVAERHHATVKLLKNGQLKVIDNNTKYGTYINGIRINEATLPVQENLQIGFSKISHEDILQYFLINNDAPLEAIKLESKVEKNKKFLNPSIDKNAMEINNTIVSEYVERPELLPVLVQKQIIKTKQKSNPVLYFLYIPLVAVLFYYLGSFIASNKKREFFIEPFKSYIPFIPTVENAFNISPLLADCEKDKELMFLIRESTPQLINTLSDSFLIFEKVCDDYESIKLTEEKNKTQKLANKLLSENITLSLLMDKKSKNSICLVCIGVKNKFSIKHYLNKRYNMQFESSFDADIFTFKDQQNKLWIPFDFDEAYPGKTSFNMSSKSIFYRFDLDRCESFPINASK